MVYSALFLASLIVCSLHGRSHLLTTVRSKLPYKVYVKTSQQTKGIIYRGKRELVLKPGDSLRVMDLNLKNTFASANIPLYCIKKVVIKPIFYYDNHPHNFLRIFNYLPTPLLLTLTTHDNSCETILIGPADYNESLPSPTWHDISRIPLTIEIRDAQQKYYGGSFTSEHFGIISIKPGIEFNTY